MAKARTKPSFKTKIDKVDDVTHVFKNLRINRLQTGVITAHINNLVKTDKHFKEKLQSDPIGVLVQFGLNRKLATSLIAETISNKGGKIGSAKITDCCCTSSVTFSCGADFYDNLPKISDALAWSKLALKK